MPVASDSESDLPVFPLLNPASKHDSYGFPCENPCLPSKYGRIVHLAMKDNPRLNNFPPRDSDGWKLEFNSRTSSEHSNKDVILRSLSEHLREYTSTTHIKNPYLTETQWNWPIDPVG